MIRAFLDANILFCAVASPAGGSALVVKLAGAKKIEAVTSRLALVEAERNISKKLKRSHLDRFRKLLNDLRLAVITEPTSREINSVGRRVSRKDAPIVAAALKSRSDFLITLNRAHLLRADVQEAFGQIAIVTPREFLMKLAASPKTGA